MRTDSLKRVEKVASPPNLAPNPLQGVELPELEAVRCEILFSLAQLPPHVSFKVRHVHQCRFHSKQLCPHLPLHLQFRTPSLRHMDYPTRATSFLVPPRRINPSLPLPGKTTLFQRSRMYHQIPTLKKRKHRLCQILLPLPFRSTTHPPPIRCAHRRILQTSVLLVHLVQCRRTDTLLV